MKCHNPKKRSMNAWPPSIRDMMVKCAYAFRNGDHARFELILLIIFFVCSLTIMDFRPMYSLIISLQKFQMFFFSIRRCRTAANSVAKSFGGTNMSGRLDNDIPEELSRKS